MIKRKGWLIHLNPKSYKFFILAARDLGPVWYMCLKTENCCLKIFVEIRVGEKVH